MSNGQPLLSICIPTFNRLHYLEESLELLLPQAQEFDVEVCVSNNCSSDGTAEYLAEKASSFTCLKYMVQKENIGLERNMVVSISMGLGCYILPIGDDEVLPEGSIFSILKELNEGVDLMILNGWYTDADLSPIRLHLPLSLQGKSILSLSAGFGLLWDKMPPGSFLASRDCFQSDCFERYLGTSHAYTGSVWDALAQKHRKEGKCKVTCMSEPTVLLRGGEKTWRKDAAKIMLYEIPKWFSLIMENNEYMDSASLIRATFLKQQTSVLSLLRFRAIGQLEYSDVEVLSGELSFNQLKKVNNVAKLPKPLAKLVVYVYDKLKIIVKKLLQR